MLPVKNLRRSRSILISSRFSPQISLQTGGLRLRSLLTIQKSNRAHFHMRWSAFSCKTSAMLPHWYFINNLIVILCRPQMSILCSLWTKALRKNRTTSWTPQKWTMKSRWKRAMFKERKGPGRASAGPSVTSAGRNLKIRIAHQDNSPCFRLELSANSLNRHVRRVHEVTLFYVW